MTNTEPPDPGRASEPTPSSQGSPEPSGSSGAGAGTGQPAGADPAVSASGGGPSGQPVSSPATGGRFARFRGGPPAATAGARGARRWPWVLGGVAALVVALLVGGFIGAGVAHHHARAAAFREHGGFGLGPHGGPGWRHGGQPGHGAMGHGQFGEGPMGGQRGGFDGHRGGLGGQRGGFGPGQAQPAAVLLGSVASVTGANLAVTPDGGAQPVTVPTNAQTRVVGTQSGALTDLKPGDRVAVRLGPDRSAIGVRMVPAKAAGTVTAQTGTTATLTRINGLTQQVDTSALTTQPKVGDRVVVRGTASGGVLKVQTLRTLPKAG